MIYDTLNNINEYKGISINLDKALTFLSLAKDATLALGRTEIEGDKIYANIISAQTILREAGSFEYHKKYIDIHFMIEGEERILISNVNKLDTISEYKEDGDYGLQRGKEEVELLLTKGKFCICFPEDSHLPLIMNNESESIKKGIIKVQL